MKSLATASIGQCNALNVSTSVAVAKEGTTQCTVPVGGLHQDDKVLVQSVAVSLAEAVRIVRHLKAVYGGSDGRAHTAS